MDCLVRRDDDTIVYVNKMHNYKPKKVDTPRPKKDKDKDIKKDKKISQEELDLIDILRLFL